MPWTTEDAKDWIDGATDRQASVGARVANAALTRCLEEGGDEESCAASAIRQAKAIMGKMKETGPVAEALVEALIMGAKEDTMDRGTRSPLREVALADGQSVQDLIRTIESEIVKATNPSGSKDVWIYVSDVFNSTVVYSVGGPNGSRYFEVAYTIGQDGKVTLGQTREVTRKTVYEPVKEEGVPETVEGAVEAVRRATSPETVFTEESGVMVPRGE